jgi:mannose-6-phosphate isomerase class I
MQTPIRLTPAAVARPWGGGRFGSVGEAIDVPPGAVHAPGPGLVLYEVMQRSDITFRIFDWGRPRPIHLEESRRALRPLVVPESIEAAAGVGRWILSDAAAPFRVERIRVDGDRIVLASEVSAVVTVVAGELEAGGTEPGVKIGTDGLLLHGGSHWFVPAGSWSIGGRGEVLVATSKA